MAEGVEGGATVVVILQGVGDGVDPAVDDPGETVLQQGLEVGQGVGPPGGDDPREPEVVKDGQRFHGADEACQDLGANGIEVAAGRECADAR